jgi:hypothetical protein
MQLLAKIKEKLPFSFGKEETEPEKVAADPAVEKSVRASKSARADSGSAAPRNTASAPIESAIKSQDEPKNKTFLDAPVVDETLLEEIEPPKSILLYVLKVVFILLVAVGIGSFLFFTSQLNGYLNFATDPLKIPSALTELKTSNEKVKEAQTDINLYRYLKGAIYLDNFSYFGDDYLKNYSLYTNESATEEEKAAAKTKMDELKKNLTDSFKAVQENLTKEITIPLVDINAPSDEELKTLFLGLLNDRIGLTDETSPDYKLYKQAQKLVNNEELRTLLKDTDFESLKDADLAVLVGKINDLTLDEFSIIQKIKNGRISWSDVINRIEFETTYVDQYFSEGYFDEVGGVQYTSYDFDATTGKITITGITKRYNTDNFTMISNLIDQLNQSPYFKNVAMKSFTKSGSADEGYTATLKLDLELQKDALDSEDKPKDVESIPSFLTPQKGVPITK